MANPIHIQSMSASAPKFICSIYVV